MKKKMRNFFTLNHKANDGFTLVELIVVIAVLAILAGVAVPAYSGYVEKAKRAGDEQLLAVLNTAYATACMENGEYDMKNLSFGPQAEIDEGVVTMNKFDTEFQRYFPASNKFKYYDMLGFNSAEGVFKGNTVAAIREAFKEFWNKEEHSFKGEEQMLLETFDQIGDMFEVLSTVGGVDLEYFLGNFSGELLDVTGLNKIFGNVNGAMNLTNEQLHDYLLSNTDYAACDTDEERAEWIANNPDKVATVKGNIAVMEFAKDAANSSSSAVKSDVESFVTMVNKADELKDEEVDYEEYFLKMCSDEDYAYYTNSSTSASDKKAMLDNFLATKNPIGLTGKEAAKWEAAAELTGAGNATGTSTLGSLYALAAGYFESTDTPHKYPLGSFDSVWEAMKSDGFDDYYKNHGATDIDAYLNFMGALSGGDVDMTDPNAFSGAGDYITDLLK